MSKCRYILDDKFIEILGFYTVMLFSLIVTDIWSIFNNSPCVFVVATLLGVMTMTLIWSVFDEYYECFGDDMQNPCLERL